MIKALEEYEAFKTICGADNADIAEESIIYCYLAIRLSPLKGSAGITENRINNIANFLATKYFEENLSIDLMVNAIFNYVNATKTCPSDRLLSDDIEALLEDYTNVYE